MAKQAANIRKLARRDLDVLSEGLVWQDAEGRIIDATASAAPILGLTLDELLGRTPHDPRWYAVHEDGAPWPGHDHPGMVALRTGLPQRNRLMGIMAPNMGRRWIRIDATPELEPGLSAPVGVVASFVDVTEEIERRHRLEEDVRQLSALYENAPCSDQVLDLDGRYLRINATGAQWLGMPRDALLGRHRPQDFMAEPSRRVFDAALQALRSGRPVDGVDVEMDGRHVPRRHLRLQARPFIERGRVVAVRAMLVQAPAASPDRPGAASPASEAPADCVSNDASTDDLEPDSPTGAGPGGGARVNRPDAPEEADRSASQIQSHLDRVQSVARVGSFALGSDPDRFRYTRETARLFDLGEHGRSGFAEWFSRVHPDDRSAVKAAWEAALAGAPYDMTYRIVARDRISWIRARADLERDEAGRLKSAVGTVQDITDLKAIEFELERSRQRLQLAIEASALGTWDYDLRTGHVDRDDRFLQMIGYAPGELESDYDSFTRIVHPDDLADVQAAAWAHFRGETAVYESEHRLRHKDGHYVWVLSIGKVVERDAASQPLRIMGTNRDISQHKRLSEGSIDLLRRIEQLIAAMHPARQIAGRSPPAAAAHARLTRRERQIAGLVATGMTSAEIAARLHLAVPTVVSHRRNLMAKLKLHSTAEVTRFAIEQGLSTSD